jgi:hypothetical protein
MPVISECEHCGLAVELQAQFLVRKYTDFGAARIVRLVLRSLICGRTWDFHERHMI